METQTLSTTPRFSEEKPNPKIVDLSREFRARNNAAFFAEVRKRLDDIASSDERFAHGGRCAIGLIGGYGGAATAIRHAQRHVRFDRAPSDWSHAFLFFDAISDDPVVNASVTKSPWIWESSLEPNGDFNLFFDRFGAAPRRLAEYNNSRFQRLRAHSVPNVAVVAFGLSQEQLDLVLDTASRPDAHRLRYDLLGLSGSWYDYITKQAFRPNPLTEGEALFSAAFVQMAYEAVGIDLTLGSHQRNTSPEHVWQAAKYFSEAFEEVGHPIRVFYCRRDPYGGLPPHDPEKSEELPPSLRALMDLLGS